MKTNLFQGQVNFFWDGPLLLAANTALMAAVMASDNPWHVKALVSKYPTAPAYMYVMIMLL